MKESQEEIEDALPKMRSFCAFGEAFTVAHALSFPKIWVHLLRNEIRWSLLDKFGDVEVEPCQTSQRESFTNQITTIEDDARLDIRTNSQRENRF